MEAAQRRSGPSPLFAALFACPLSVAGDAVLTGLEAGGVGVCVCDERDVVRYSNDVLRRAFFAADPEDGADFARDLVRTIQAGRGLKLNSMTPLDFETYVRRRRRDQVGSVSFTADTVDGRWWWATDSKLPNGWLVSIAQDISLLKKREFELQAAHASALEEASTDALTGIPNRRQGLRSGEALFRDRGAGRGLTVAMLDVDHFKGINDRHGHDVGDLVLTRFAATVTSVLEAGDQFSRIGGEEFLIATPEADPDYCLTLLSRIRAALAPLVLEGQAPLRYTVSAGVAAACAADTWPRLLQRADAALYRAKANGRDRVEQAVALG